jgi:hypothetical protein
MIISKLVHNCKFFAFEVINKWSSCYFFWGSSFGVTSDTCASDRTNNYIFENQRLKRISAIYTSPILTNSSAIQSEYYVFVLFIKPMLNQCKCPFGK